MENDIGPLLKKWKYMPNDINVRIIKGQGGKPKLQMRLDLGILQMELEGRPDGRRPHRFDSYLTYYEQKAMKSRIQDGQRFILQPMDCMLLQQEAIQFYHRYLALMKLGDFKRVTRDTSRNLEVFNFVMKHTDDEEILWSFEQYRPYVIMMNTRANASLNLDKGNYNAALASIKKGIVELKKYYERYDDRVGADRYELEFLTEWADEIKTNKPLSEREKIQQQMERAIKEEEYEHAARLRDKLKGLE